jgi:hypothetical protein
MVDPLDYRRFKNVLSTRHIRGGVIFIQVRGSATDIIRDTRRNQTYSSFLEQFLPSNLTGSVYKDVVHILKSDNVGE